MKTMTVTIKPKAGNTLPKISDITYEINQLGGKAGGKDTTQSNKVVYTFTYGDGRTENDVRSVLGGKFKTCDVTLPGQQSGRHAHR